MPAPRSAATDSVASREKRRNASRRSSRASGQTHTASTTSPPTHRRAAERWIQSASSVAHELPGSAAWCPDSDSPEANPSASKKAGQSRTTRSRSHASEEPAAPTMGRGREAGPVGRIARGGARLWLAAEEGQGEPGPADDERE